MNALAQIPAKTVTSGYRAIKDGSRYNQYFPKPEERDRVIIEDGEVTDTVELMEKVVWKYLDDTKRIAPLLRRSTTEATCRAIWEFVYGYIQYKLDKRGLEQLRRPARSWAERNTGVDCDCMSIFVSSILTNLQIPHKFRITMYSGDSWQHVYVLVPLGDENNYCVIDGVVSEFNYEKKYTKKMDFTMSLNGINVAVLSGVSSNDHYNAVMANSLTGLGANSGAELDKIYENIVATRNAIAQDPSLVSSTDDPKALLQMLDYAIQYWHTDKRNQALDILAQNEAQLNLRNGVKTINGLEYDPDELTLSGVNVKGFFTNVKKSVNTAGQKVGDVAKKAVKAVVKYNPLTLAARGGFLLAMKLNLGKMANKLKWGYGTPEQARAKGIAPAQYQKSKTALTKVEHLFADKLQGSREVLKNTILNGRAGNLSGVVIEQLLGYLGDPVTASAIAAATPVIIATINILKDAGLVGKDEKLDIDSLTKEMDADPNAASAFSEIQQDDAGSSSEDTDPNAQTPKAVTKSTSTGGGIMEFIKKNPVPVAIGGGLLALGIYQMVKPKAKPKGLSGVRTAPRPKTLASAAKSSTSKSKTSNKKPTVKTVKLF
jgi:hypothetical protein